MTRFIKAVFIFTITFLCISTESCEGTHFLKGTGKSTAKSALLAREFAQLERRMTNDQFFEIMDAFAVFDENGDYNITLGELGRVLKKSGKILSVDDLKAMIKIMDGNGDGVVDIVEFEEYWYIQIKDIFTEDDIKQKFKTYDLNGDGFIVGYELGLVKMVVDDKNYTKKEIDDIVAEADVNSDGKVTYQEFAQEIKKKQRRLTNAQLKVIEKYFKTFDDNGDGDITLGELGKVLKKSGKILSAEELKTMITIMDVNGNGIVNYSELEDYMATLMKDPVTEDIDLMLYFNGHDLNGDGFIDSSELGLLYKVFFKKNFTKKEIDDKIAEAEVDYDGKVTYEEFVEVVIELRKEHEEMEEIFEMFDENGDGNITMGELRRFLKKSGKILSADELKTVITAMDSNGDGKLDFSEFEYYMKYQMKDPITEEGIKQDFKTHDLNGDGYVISSEVALVLKVLHDKNYTKEEIDEMFAEADVNSDGKATYKEFAQMIKRRQWKLSEAKLERIVKYFKKFDKNGDRKITSAELEGVLKESGKILSADDLKTMITIMDGNGNGTVDIFEFEDYNAILLKNPVTIGEIKRYFNAYDVNGDGFIVSYELGLVLKVFSSRNFTTKEIDDMLAEIEVNFDGKLIYKEMEITVNRLNQQSKDIENTFKKIDDIIWDEKISVEELGSYLKTFGRVLTADELKTVITAMDKDGDGMVDLSEFQKFRDSQLKIKSTENDIKDYFKTFDLNGDGFIKFCEMALVTKVFGEKNYTKEAVHDKIDEADVDHDGKVNLQEFAQVVKTQRQLSEKIMKYFTMLDENWDGKITLEELETVMKKSGKILSADELKTVIAAIDDNGDGEVVLLEFRDYRIWQLKKPFTEEDIEEDFKTYDFNGDGFIVSSELALVMKVFHTKRYTEKEIDEKIAEADGNSDGKLTYKEFYQDVIKILHMEEIVDSFDMFDENRDENITLGELESVMKKSGKKLSANELKTIITAMDGNGNGMVDYSEFKDYRYSQIKEPLRNEDDIKHYFKSLDFNGDGFITSDELALVAKVFYEEHFSEEDIDDMIAEADLSCDEKASYQEFAQMVKEHDDM